MLDQILYIFQNITICVFSLFLFVFCFFFYSNPITDKINIFKNAQLSFWCSCHLQSRGFLELSMECSGVKEHFCLQNEAIMSGRVKYQDMEIPNTKVQVPFNFGVNCQTWWGKRLSKIVAWDCRVYVVMSSPIKHQKYDTSVKNIFYVWKRKTVPTNKLGQRGSVNAVVRHHFTLYTWHCAKKHEMTLTVKP